MVPAFAEDRLWNKMIPIIESWRNTPYRHMTMVKQRGADCTLFLAACYQEAGIMARLKKPDYYPRDWNVHTNQEMVKDNLIEHLDNHLANGYGSSIFEKDEITSDDFMRGDLIAFKTPRSKCTNHTAMWLGKNNWMVNCIQSMGVVNLEYNRAWNRCFTTLYRIMVKEI